MLRYYYVWIFKFMYGYVLLHVMVKFGHAYGYWLFLVKYGYVRICRIPYIMYYRGEGQDPSRKYEMDKISPI